MSRVIKPPVALMETSSLQLEKSACLLDWQGEAIFMRSDWLRGQPICGGKCRHAVQGKFTARDECSSYLHLLSNHGVTTTTKSVNIYAAATLHDTP